MKSTKRILIAGIGNIFFGDDAFGCEVAKQLALRSWPEGVQLRDFGIRGLNLAYALTEPLDHVILIDAVPRGGPPGTLYFIEPNLDETPSLPQHAQILWDAHTMNPVQVLRLARSMGASLKKVLLIGCEPGPFDPDADLQSELTEPVRLSVDQVVYAVESIVDQLVRGDPVDYETLSFRSPPTIAAGRSDLNIKEIAT